MLEFVVGWGAETDAPKGSCEAGEREGLSPATHTKREREKKRVGVPSGLCMWFKEMLLTLFALHFCSGRRQQLDKGERCGAFRWRAGQCRANSDSPVSERRKKENTTNKSTLRL